MFVRTPYNYDMRLAGMLTATFNTDPSLAQQSGKDDADINVIVKRFNLTGMVSQVPLPPTYDDFTGVSTFLDAMNLIRAGEESFAAMSADTRSRFGNDPAAFVEFCSDPANLEEMRKMGLAVPKEEPASPPDPTRVIVVATEASASDQKK